MALNHFIHLAEVPVDQVNHVIGEQGFSHRYEPPHIGEEDRHESLLAYRCRRNPLRPLIHLGCISSVENKPPDCHLPGDRGLTGEPDFGREPKAIGE